MPNAKTSKTDTKSDASSPHGETQKVNLLEMVLEMVKDIASLKTAVRLLIASMFVVLSVMGWAFNFLLGEIDAGRDEQQQTRIELMTEIAEVKTEVAVLNERQIFMQETLAEILFIIRRSADPETLNAINDLFNDTSIEPPDDTTSNPPSNSLSDTISDAGDAPSTISTPTQDNLPL